MPAATISTAAKARGVSDVAFHKKRGLAIEDMVKSRWVYRKLRNFRAGIEAGISCLKRAYGLATLHLARARPLQGLRLVLGGRPQPRALRPPQTGIAAPLSGSSTTRDRRNAGRRQPCSPNEFLGLRGATSTRNRTASQRTTPNPHALLCPQKTSAFMDGH